MVQYTYNIENKTFNIIRISIRYLSISDKIYFVILKTYLVDNILGEIYVPSKYSQNTFTSVCWDVCSVYNGEIGGVELNDCWHKIQKGQVMACFKDLLAVKGKFESALFPQIGSFYFKKDMSPKL